MLHLAKQHQTHSSGAEDEGRGSGEGRILMDVDHLGEIIGSDASPCLLNVFMRIFVVYYWFVR